MILVLGMGARTPFGVGSTVLLEGLSRASAVFAPYAPFERAGIRAPIAAKVPDEAIHARGVAPWPDRAARLLEGAVRDALTEATGHDSIEGLPVRPDRVALVAGTSSSGIGPFCAAQAEASRREMDDARYSSATHGVARALGLRGAVMVICNVCASGALAIAEAAELLLTGVADVVIAAGFDPLEPFVAAGFDSLGALTDQPRPFRADRRGLALGEGSAALVLAREKLAGRSPVGVVQGWGSSADAYHLTAPDPRGVGVARAIANALRQAEILPDAIGVINAHGTGTPFNDAMETTALVRVFGPRCGGKPVYTVKGTIGHTLGAAGAIEAVASLAAMRARVIPPTVTSGSLDPACDLDIVVDAPRPSDATRTLSLSSAFGGANCALVLGTAPEGL